VPKPTKPGDCLRRDDGLFLCRILPAKPPHAEMTVPTEIERYVREVNGLRRGIALGDVRSWETVPIVRLLPNGRLSAVDGRLGRFRLEFTSGLAVCGIVSPETGDFALLRERADDALSEAISRAEELRDGDSDLAIFEVGDYAVVGVLFLAGGLPLAVTVHPEPAEALPVRDVIAMAYGMRSATD